MVGVSSLLFSFHEMLLLVVGRRTDWWTVDEADGRARRRRPNAGVQAREVRGVPERANPELH